jgi:tubulin polyglutamylase TTLL5
MTNPPKQPKDLGYYYKALGNETSLITYTLEDNGFIESNSKEFTILWSSGNVKPIIYLNLRSFQRINHFPKSFEITRKDLLYKNISKMNATFGAKGQFDFVPQSFILPSEYAFLDEVILLNK